MSNIFDLFKKIETKPVAPTAPVSWLIVGLGNPGMKYENTRHNTGFMALDAIAKKHGITVKEMKFSGLVGDGNIGDVHVLLLKPQTLMNLSGKAVSEAANFYKIAPDHVLVLSDDITLPVGRMRARKKGSAGGHNGLKDIIAKIGSEDFSRIRIGIGEKPHPDYDLADWVLSEFKKDENAKLNALFDCLDGALPDVFADRFDTAVQKCNSYGTETKA